MKEKFEVEWARVDWNVTEIVRDVLNQHKRRMEDDRVLALEVRKDKQTGENITVTLLAQTALDDTTYRILGDIHADTYKKLEDQLLNEGQITPIIIWDGRLFQEPRIVDGRYRYRILKKHNIDMKVIFYDFIDDTECRLWIAKNDAGKRELSDAEKCLSVIEHYSEDVERIMEMKQKHQPIRKEYADLISKLIEGDFNKRKNITAQYILAKIARVSQGTFAQFQQIKKHFDDKKDNAAWNKAYGSMAKDRMDKQRRSIYNIYNDVKAAERKERQEKAEEERRRDLPKDIVLGLFNKKFQDILDNEIPPNSIDLVYADIPYRQDGTEAFSLTEIAELAEFAKSKLKDTGVLLVQYDNHGINKLYRTLDAHELQYLRTVCDPKTEFGSDLTNGYALAGASSALKEHNHDFCSMNNDLRTMHCWKPILIYCKDKKKAAVHNPKIIESEDVVWNTSKPARGIGNWKQSDKMVEQTIETYSLLGDTVLDPVAGYGSTVAACLTLQRKVYAIEMLKDRFDQWISPFAPTE